MLKNNLRFAFRHLSKNPTITTLNFVGLTLGLAVALIIGLHVRHEWLTDSFVPEPERTFRAVRVSGVEGKPYEIGITSPNYSDALRTDFAHSIKATTRFYADHIIVSVGEKHFHERKYAYADANFFEFFNLNLLLGDPKTALQNPESVVLTQPTAEKLFGSAAAAMGKTIRWDNRRDVQVTGVFAGFPVASHMEFDYLAAIHFFQNEEWFSGWWNNLLSTYVRLAPGATAASVNAALPNFMDKYFGKDFAQQGGRIDLKLQPLDEIYWNSETRYDPVRHGNRSAVQIFALAAVLLVVMACFNFINLSTARAADRSREVGVRKTLGAGRGELSRQFLLESLLLVAFSVGMAVFVAAAALPFFNQKFDLALKITDLSWLEIGSGLLGLTALVGLAAGFYPSILLASFRPATVLKQKANLSKNTIQLRRGLTVVQFTLSITLIISTLIVREQLDFLKNSDLGFERENVVVIETWGTGVRREKLATYREKIKNYPAVLGQTITDAVPGSQPDGSIIEIAGRSDRPKINVLYADFEFAKTLGVPLVAGRDFDARLSTDTVEAVLMNEAACRVLNLAPADAVGLQITPVYFDTLKHRVVGVLRDYHFLSLREKIDPLIIIPNYQYPGTLAVRTAAGSLENTLNLLKNDWQTLAPNVPFEFRMLDERLAKLYATEEKQGKLFAFFAAAAILIACLGMFGLATLLAVQRTKEIGIRKVLGASVASISNLLISDFLKLVVAAVVVAAPVAYYFKKNWLSDFAYRIQIEWWMFVVAGAAAVAIAFLTVGFQSVRAALANPVQSLRSE